MWVESSLVASNAVKLTADAFLCGSFNAGARLASDRILTSHTEDIISPEMETQKVLEYRNCSQIAFNFASECNMQYRRGKIYGRPIAFHLGSTATISMLTVWAQWKASKADFLSLH